MKKRIFDIVGESFENSDGTSRQQVLAKCNPGDAVLLERQPDNKHGSNAIFVKTHPGHGVGYIGNVDAKILAPIIDSGRTYRAQVHELRGGIDDYETIGCRIAIAFENEKFRPTHAIKKEQTYVSSDKGGCLGTVAIFFGTSILLLLNR